MPAQPQRGERVRQRACRSRDLRLAAPRLAPSFSSPTTAGITSAAFVTIGNVTHVPFARRSTAVAAITSTTTCMSSRCRAN